MSFIPVSLHPGSMPTFPDRAPPLSEKLMNCSGQGLVNLIPITPLYQFIELVDLRVDRTRKLQEAFPDNALLKDFVEIVLKEPRKSDFLVKACLVAMAMLHARPQGDHLFDLAKMMLELAKIDADQFAKVVPYLQCEFIKYQDDADVDHFCERGCEFINEGLLILIPQGACSPFMAWFVSGFPREHIFDPPLYSTFKGGMLNSKIANDMYVEFLQYCDPLALSFEHISSLVQFTFMCQRHPLDVGGLSEQEVIFLLRCFKAYVRQLTPLSKCNSPFTLIECILRFENFGQAWTLLEETVAFLLDWIDREHSLLTLTEPFFFFLQMTQRRPEVELSKGIISSLKSLTLAVEANTTNKMLALNILGNRLSQDESAVLIHKISPNQPSISEIFAPLKTELKENHLSKKEFIGYAALLQILALSNNASLLDCPDLMDIYVFTYWNLRRFREEKVIEKYEAELVLMPTFRLLEQLHRKKAFDDDEYVEEIEDLLIESYSCNVHCFALRMCAQLALRGHLPELHQADLNTKTLELERNFPQGKQGTYYNFLLEAITVLTLRPSESVELIEAFSVLVQKGHISLLEPHVLGKIEICFFDTHKKTLRPFYVNQQQKIFNCLRIIRDSGIRLRLEEIANLLALIPPQEKSARRRLDDVKANSKK